MDDPQAKPPQASKVALPWESIDPTESDPGPIPPVDPPVAPIASLPPHVGPQELRPFQSRDRQGAKSAVLHTPLPDGLRRAQSSRRGSEAVSEPLAIPASVPIPPIDPDEPTGEPVRGGGWTLPLICAGIALIACCLIIPQADSNRRLAYQKRMLEMDLESIQKQVTVNDAFLARVGSDPTLAERLAQRQMKMIRAGSRVVKLGDRNSRPAADMSPFALVNVPPPVPLPPYKPVGGVLANLCYQPRSRLYMTGIALFTLAAGLVLGLGKEKQ